MRTKLNGKYLPIAVAVVGITFSISIAILVGHYQADKAQKAEQEIVLTKDKWHCFAGMLNDNSEFECMIYKRKDVDFGTQPRSRHRDNNIPKGKPVQQTE